MLEYIPTVLENAGIYYELYEHDPVFTHEEAEAMKAEKGFTGAETKSLFLKDKKGNHYIFFTLMEKRTDFKKLREVVGKRLSVVRPEEMQEITGQTPGAVAPFGYKSEHVPFIIDEEVYQHERHVYAPGRPDRTVVTLSADLPQIIEAFDLETYLVPQE